jgi:hypothetical protein
MVKDFPLRFGRLRDPELEPAAAVVAELEAVVVAEPAAVVAGAAVVADELPDELPPQPATTAMVAASAPAARNPFRIITA